MTTIRMMEEHDSPTITENQPLIFIVLSFLDVLP